MKKILFTVYLFLCVVSLKAQTIEPTMDFDNNSPVFKFETEVIDYGKIEQKSDGYRIFKFKNVGNAPLIVTSVKGSCGCTVPTKPEAPIMPGETGEIKVKYDTNRIGKFSKSVTIISNASEARKTVRIKGDVLKS